MTKLVGILNITPDSFSEPTSRLETDIAIAHAAGLIADGADVIDVGAESTRPRAEPLTADAEWARLAAPLPAIVALAHEAGIPVSLDTRHPRTAARGLEAGVDWINDQTGFVDAEMRRVVAGSAGPLVLMHALTVPVDPAVKLPPGEPGPHLRRFFEARLEAMARDGIDTARVILDPGIGFGPSPAQAIAIMADAAAFALGHKVLIGHSRKSFFALVTDRPAPERDDVTLLASAFMMRARVDYLRVHDIARHKALATALAALDPPMAG
ncbi:dihydropteroate synthase [Acuticoccus sp. M5D2P5]|uniref:dihydropteroate synthase n=1 Tax=Acuticoccus kalidii TaxID=2910977 RepID=UPI001F270E15|nr:dihydropteroate synthase [Acuticoccus kalidii]MCF3933057.1 dihydropteroate synthase [Acuticoccus kalidii]